MKPPERFPPDDPREWLNRARSNLVRAKVFVSGAYLEDLCFDAQQASEKAIKAVMIGRVIGLVESPMNGISSASQVTRATLWFHQETGGSMLTQEELLDDRTGMLHQQGVYRRHWKRLGVPNARRYGRAPSGARHFPSKRRRERCQAQALPVALLKAGVATPWSSTARCTTQDSRPAVPTSSPGRPRQMPRYASNRAPPNSCQFRQVSLACPSLPRSPYCTSACWSTRQPLPCHGGRLAVTPSIPVRVLVRSSSTWFGGVTRQVWVDNHKAAVTAHVPGAVRFNERFKQLARHYAFNAEGLPSLLSEGGASGGHVKNTSSSATGTSSQLGTSGPRLLEAWRLFRRADNAMHGTVKEVRFGRYLSAITTGPHATPRASLGYAAT